MAEQTAVTSPTLGTGRRKEAVARVRLVQGTGQFHLNGRSLESYFPSRAHRMIVTGPRRLNGRSLDSRDLRSGMALIAAALAADGESRVAPLETVERGYSRLVERLQSLGARVTRLS